MYRKGLLLLICFFLFFSFSNAFAQKGFTIKGQVKDEHEGGLYGASVSLKDKNSGKYVSGTSADTSGFFQLPNIPSGSYVLNLSYLGYEDVVRELFVLNDMDLGNLSMKNIRAGRLDVAVKGRQAAMLQNEDTTEFNASSYKVNADASAEDLIRKMPGMDLSSGKPKAQGEEITKVLVDGKPFFGDDATSSLRNLPAEVIDRIQLYDERSEQAQFTGFDDGNTTKTINIKTKPDKKEGAFGKVFAGYGYDAKYSAGGNVNYFKNNRRISLIGQTNNINVQNFDSQDLLGITGGGGGRRGGRGGRDNNFMVNQEDGISKANAIGLNYSDQWGEKVEVTGSYFFNNTSNVAIQDVSRDYVLPEQRGQKYLEESERTTNNFNHRFNLRLNYTIDSFNSILFVPNFSTQKRNSSSYLKGETFEESRALLSRTINNYENDVNSYNLSSMLLYRHKFKKQGRTFSLWANARNNAVDGTNTLMAENNYSDAQINEDLNQRANTNNQGWNLNSNITYTEPLSKRSFLQIRYGLRYEDGYSDKRTYNFDEALGEYSLPDSLLSNSFTTWYLTNSGGLAYRFSDSNWRFNIGVNIQNAQLSNERILPRVYDYNRQFNDILPYAMFNYQFSKLKSLRLFYRTFTDAPSVNQLQDVIDNSNPLLLSSGNPDLDQAYQHRLRLRYNATNPGKSTNFFAMLSADVTNNYIGRSTLVADSNMLVGDHFLLPKGAQFIKPENMSGYFNVNGYATYGMPVDFLKSNLNLNAQAGIVRTPGLVNSQKNYASNTNLGFGFTLGSNISENIDFTLSSTASYNWVENSLNTNADNRFYNQNSRLAVNYTFWKGLVAQTDLNHQLYTGLSAGFNQNFLLWNMGIGKKLFNRQGEIKLSVFDLLGQNSSIQRTVSEIYVQDVRTNVLQRYYLLTFTYNLRFFKGNSSMKDAVPRTAPEGGYWH